MDCISIGRSAKYTEFQIIRAYNDNKNAARAGGFVQRGLTRSQNSSYRAHHLMSLLRFAYIRRIARKRSCRIDRPAGMPVRARTFTIECHHPEQPHLYQHVEQYHPALMSQLAAQGATLPAYVQREFDACPVPGPFIH